MATSDLRRGFGTPSALAVDLALAKVDLAALRARRGQEAVGEEARTAAGLLHRFFSRQLHAASNPALISAELVPEQSIREAIQESLASLSTTKQGFGEGDTKLLNKLVQLLSVIADNGCCTRDTATKLHSALAELDEKLAAPSPSPEEATLSELLNAFS